MYQCINVSIYQFNNYLKIKQQLKVPFGDLGEPKNYQL